MEFKISLSNRISLGYLFIIVIGGLASLVCIKTLMENQTMDRRVQTSYKMLYMILNDFNILLVNSQKLSNDWVFNPNADEKAKLALIHRTEYPEMRKKIDNILLSNETESADTKIKDALHQFEIILTSQKELMSILSADSLYGDDVSIDKAITILESKITRPTEELRKSIIQIAQAREKNIASMQEVKQSSSSLLSILLISMILIFVTAAIIAHFYTKKSVVKPISKLKNTIMEVGDGKIVEVKFDKRNDEIGEMTDAITRLMEGVNKKVSFAVQIGKGNYNENFKLVSENDIMGSALLDMRKNLKLNAEEEYKRNWATQGLAEIGNLLRKQTDSKEELYVNIIQFIVKYLKGNQGGLFLVNDSDNNDKYMELVACYAWEKRKYVDKRIELTEGLVGQCYLEGLPIYMTDVPKSYIKITSGLGDALPTALLLVPLKVNDEILGVIEVAAFHEFANYQIAFVEKLAENIASTIASVRVAENTKVLLKSTQQQAEELRAQEEEMRQNMEELNATQEEMARKESEYVKQIKELREELNAKNDALERKEFESYGGVERLKELIVAKLFDGQLIEK